MFMGVLWMGAGCLKALVLTKLKSAGCFLGSGLSEIKFSGSPKSYFFGLYCIMIS